MRTPAEFWARVDDTDGPDGCWPWSGATNGKGVGQLKYRPLGITRFPAHRVAWFILNGQLPPTRYVIRQTCANALCCNPDHLEAVPRRAIAARGERVPTHRLTAKAVRMARAQWASGARIIDLAKIYSVSVNTMSDVCHCRLWQHVR